MADGGNMTFRARVVAITDEMVLRAAIWDAEEFEQMWGARKWGDLDDWEQQNYLDRNRKLLKAAIMPDLPK